MYQANQLKIYDAGESVYDRYSVLYLDSPEREKGLYECRAMSANPFHPMGFCEMTSAKLGKHLGKPIQFTALPDACQKVIIRDYYLDTNQYNLSV